MAKMGASEALVEGLLAEKTSMIMGLVGSAFMDALDIFPKAGIRFVPVRHEQSAAHMADAYARVSGTVGVCTAQNGPGVTNLVTAVAAAYQAHTPMVVITPAATSASLGTDGFQETDQMKIFAPITKYQVRVNRGDRIPELLRNCFRIAVAEQGPTQLDLPRDLLYDVVDVELLTPDRYRVSGRGAGDPEALDRAAKLLGNARFPVVISGAGVAKSKAYSEVAALAEYLSAPVVNSYLHNDSFPHNHPLAAGPLGYGGSKAAMRLLSKADVVLALGSRLSAFGTVPQYDFDFWPSNAKLIQIDVDHRQVGRIRPIDVGILGDARQAAIELVNRMKQNHPEREENSARVSEITQEKANWAKELESLSKSTGTPISPRRALRELENALPFNSIVTTDIGNTCSLANAYLKFQEPGKFLAALTYGNCGFAYPAALGAKLADPGSPVVAYVGDGAWGITLMEVLTAVQEDIPVVAVVFNNNQWGAEKKNQVDFYENRFIGTNLMSTNYAAIAKEMGAEAARVEDPGDIQEAFRAAVSSEKPAVLEILTDPQELFDPFRRDALKKPVRYLNKYQ